MPRFVGLPVVVEAFEFKGSIVQWPEAFRLAVQRHIPGGVTEVVTGDGVRPLRDGDWITRGPDGSFSVVRAAAFETYFGPLGGLVVDAQSAAEPEVSGRRSGRK